MPGFAGFVSSASSAECRARLNAMIGSMSYEPHFGVDAYLHPATGVYLAWTYDKASGRPPRVMLWQSSFAALLLYGHSTVDVEEAQRTLTSCGLGSREMFPSLGEGGAEALRCLGGCISGLVIDKVSQTAFVFNDRYGINRLFVYEGRDGLCFASEAKAILAAFPETRQFDSSGLAEFFSCGSTIGARSLFKDVQVLGPASVWSVTRRGVERKRNYFSSEGLETQSPLDPESFIDTFLATAPQAISRHAAAPHQVGVSATGGLDSRMVLACVDDSTNRYPCYTFGSMYRDTYDVRAARQVAQMCRQTHTVFELGESFLRQFPEYLERSVYCSDGYLGLSGAAELYMNELARGVSIVRLTGNYGSELLRGARAFKAATPRTGFLAPAFDTLVKDAARRFEECCGTGTVTFALSFQAAHQGFGRRQIEQSQVELRTPFLDEDLLSVIYRAPALPKAGYDACVSLIGQQRPALLGVATDRGLLGPGSALARGLRRVTRECLFKGEYLAGEGMPHAAAVFAKGTARGQIEKALLGRHKFQHFTRWLREDLAKYVKEVVSAASPLHEYVEEVSLASMVQDHIDGRGNFTDEIDKVLTAAVAARLLFRSGRRADSCALDKAHRSLETPEHSGPVSPGGLG